MTWYRAGSRLDPPGAAGTAHFLEHMMFKGTKRFGKGEIDRLTARYGGFNNGFTSYDFTAYCFSFPAGRWRQALEIEADRMIGSLFLPDEFELEKQVILEELKMEQDDPWEMLREAVALEVFKEHPYRFPVAGVVDDVRSLTCRQVEDFYRTYYVPNNTVLTLVGSLDENRALDEIERHFGRIPPAELPPDKSPSEPQPERLRRIEVSRPSPVSRLLIAWPVPPFDPSEFAVIEVADQILAGGKLSRLYRRLLERKPLLSLLTSEYAESRDPYVYTLRMELKEDAEVDAVEEVVFEEMYRLADSDPTAEEMERAVTRSIVQFIGDLETTFDQAFQLGISEVLGHGNFVREYAAHLRSVAPEQIVQLVRRSLQREKATIAVMKRTDHCC